MEHAGNGLPRTELNPSITPDKEVWHWNKYPLSSDTWDDRIPPRKALRFALSRTTDRVLQILLRATSSACGPSRSLKSGMSSTTLRRLRADHPLPVPARPLAAIPLRTAIAPGLAAGQVPGGRTGLPGGEQLYRAFRRWTGLTYSEYKLRYCWPRGSARTNGWDGGPYRQNARGVGSAFSSGVKEAVV